MAVPTPAEADAATVRMRLVADMLLQKSQEVQRKGNAGAAQSLADSAADLQRAASLLLELARLVHLPPPRLRSDSDASLCSVASHDGSTISSLSVASLQPRSVGGPPAASASVKDLVAKLSRVDAMLGKKSDEMKLKGNDNAAHALQQSALVVRLAAQHIAEQQLMTRTLVVSARALREQLREHCRVLLIEDDISDETTIDDELTRRALERLKTLVAMHEVVQAVAPDAASPDDLKELLLHGAPSQPASAAVATDRMEELERLENECASLQRLHEESQARHEQELREANEATESMRNQCEALQKALGELEKEYHERRERELEHLNARHERQKGTHEELKKLLLAKEEEVSALKIQTESWMNQVTQQQETLVELRERRELDQQFYDRQSSELRDQLHAREGELKALSEEMHILHRQLEERSSSDHEGQEKAASVVIANEKIIEELRHEIEASRAKRDALLVEREDKFITKQEAQLQVDTLQNEYQLRREEMEKRIEELNKQVHDREARIAELQTALGDANDVSFDDPQLKQEPADEVERLQRDLDDERANRAELNQLYEDAKASVQAIRKELNEYKEQIELLKKEQKRHLEGESAQAALARQQQEHANSLEVAMKQSTARIEDLELNLGKKDNMIAQLTTRADSADLAASVAQAELSTRAQELQELQSVLTQVRDEKSAWRQELVSIAKDFGCEKDTAREASTAEDLSKGIRMRWSDMVEQLKGLEVRCADLVSRHANELTDSKESTEAELKKIQVERDALTAAIGQLKENNALLEKQLEALKNTHHASLEENDSEELKTRLANVEADFERYRTRSHAALKKVEKRAELLNSMRKDNESLTQVVSELKSALSTALKNERTAVDRLEEMTHNQLMREEDFFQQIGAFRENLSELESRCTALDAENQDLVRMRDEATVKISGLQAEKEELARAKHVVHEQTLELKEAELQENTRRLEEVQDVLAQLENQSRSQAEVITDRDERIKNLQNEVHELRELADNESLRVQELERTRTDLEARTEELAAALAVKESELLALEALRDSEKKASIAAEDMRQEETGSRESADKDNRDARESELRIQLQSASRETEELTNRLVEIQLAKVAAEQETEKLRVEVALLKSEMSNTTTPPIDEPEASAVREEQQRAQEEKILRLVDEIEQAGKRRTDDERRIANLEEKLRDAENSLQESRRKIISIQETAKNSHDGSGIHQALELTVETLRARVAELESEQVKSPPDDVDDDEVSPPEAPEDLSEIQSNRQAKREQYELQLETTKRKKLVDDYLKKTTEVINELQLSMDEYSSVFRDACALRDEANEKVNGHTTSTEGAENGVCCHVDGSNDRAGKTEYEEYLTLKSGVVVKAGATFSLPVYCDKPGWRVEWKFAVKEDGADVGFALSLETTLADGRRTREAIVSPSRVNELAGVYDASTAGAATETAALHFEWDNSFSWLNEKTLDYHVSVLEPSSESKKTLRSEERRLQREIATVDERLEMLRVERERREHLQSAVQHFEQCEEEKNAHLKRFGERRTAIQKSKAGLQVKMEDLQSQLRTLVGELDDMAKSERDVLKAWNELRSEHEDVDMTVRLSAYSRLDELTETLKARKKHLEAELQTTKNTLAHS